METIAITTADGECPCDVMTPPGEGPWPAVIVYMDAFGIRPALRELAQRLADSGYMVLLPDIFYRSGPYPPMVPKEALASGKVRSITGPRFALTSNHKAAEDTAFLLDYLEKRSDVASERTGAVGFCMGGGMALTAAAYQADRIAAVASFHGGMLATDEPTSPHLHVSSLKAEILVAGADNDHLYPLEMAQRLEAALNAAGVRHHCEIYPARHGWMMPDFPVYDQIQAERGWAEMLALFDRSL